MKLTTRSFTFRQLCALMLSIAAGLAILGLVASAENGSLVSRSARSKFVSSSAAQSEKNAGQRVIHPLGAVAPSVTATLTDNIPQGTKVIPGSTINYTAVISNGGVSPADDAANVAFTSTLDANSTLLGSAHASPLAFNDTYNWVGNTVLDTSARALPSVTANDVAITDTFTLTSLTNAPTTLGGLVTLGADGHFVYTPEAGDSGTDTFTYTITNTADGSLSGTGTVSINLPVRVWYLQAGASGDGRSNTPSGNPAGISIAANQTTDIIYVLFSASALNGAFTLDGGQQLLGQGVALVANSITLLPAGSSPTITNTGGNVVTLNSTNGGNTISGLIIGDSSGIDITGTNFGLLSASSLTLNGTGRPLNLSTGTLSATFANLISTSSPGGAGINLVSVGGSLTVSGTTSIAGAGTQGISISGSSLAANFGSSTTIGSTTQGILVGTSTGNISFGNTTITAGTDGVSLQNNSAGTRSFGSLSITNGSGVGFLHAVGGGSTTVSGQTTITNPGGRGIDIQDSTTSVTFSNVNVTQSGGTGVFLDDNSGAVSFADLDISPDSGQRAFQATEPHSSAITTTSGTIATTNATGVEIVGTSSASRTPLNMQLTTVSVTGGNIAANGILLSNTSVTGSPGGFRVLGNAGLCTSGTPTCTGGRIQQTTGADGSTAARGVSLNNADTVVLTRMRIDNHPNFAIKGDNVNGFTLDSSLVDGTNGNNEGLDEAAVKFDNLLGTCAVTASDISGGREHNFHVLNTSGTLTSLSISGSTFRDNQTATGADGVNVDAQGTAVMTVTGTSNTFTRNRQEHFRASARNTATMNVHFGSLAAGNTLTGGHPAGLSQSTTFSTESSARLNFNILGNSINGAILSAITIFQANTTTVGLRANGTISGNTIGTSGVASSGSSQGDGIAVTSTGLGTTNVSITNNQIRQ
ncbi:MAG TPA: Ig-like domain-containing protein, partial [Pyrinomonadaceae bacterium]|nr:Ig-like domain-containing protein [Pyrinomonadaceae bacterium]